MSEKQELRTTYVKEVKSRKPKPDARTAICITNHIIEMKVYERACNDNLSKIRRLSKTEYLDTETGEVKEYKSQSKGGNSNGSGKSDIRNLNRSFENLRRLINENFVGNKNELHLVLTYGIEMNDRGRISNDFKNFWKRLKAKFGQLEYICIYEPFDSGAWHIHVLMKKIDSEMLYLDSKEIADIWGYGYVKVKRICNNDNIGAYFTVLVRKGESGNVSEKSLRLKYYGKNKKLYTKSRGIIIPPLVTITYEEAEKLLKGHHKVCDKTLSIRTLEDDVEVNRIRYMQFNDKRRK